MSTGTQAQWGAHSVIQQSAALHCTGIAQAAKPLNHHSLYQFAEILEPLTCLTRKDA